MTKYLFKHLNLSFCPQSMLFSSSLIINYAPLFTKMIVIILTFIYYVESQTLAKSWANKLIQYKQGS